MKIQEIMKFISSLRKSRKKMVSNYYLNYQGSDEDFETWTGEETIVFCAKEERIVRCFFSSTDEKELSVLLKNVPQGAVLDFVTKDKTPDFSWAHNGGFEQYTLLIRCTNPDLFQVKKKTKRELLLEEFADESVGDFAAAEDVEELYDLLYEIFDSRVSQLPSMDELLEMIEKKWVVLYRLNGRIISFCMYQVEGRKYYGYQIYNEGTADISYNLERKAMRYAIENYHVKSSYAWVEVGNQGANKRVGADFDGTYDYIFEKCRA